MGDHYLLTPHGCWLLDPGVAQRVRNSSGQQMCDCTVGSASGLTFFRVHERIRRWWLVAWGRLKIVRNFFFLLSLFICIPCIINMISCYSCDCNKMCHGSVQLFTRIRLFKDIESFNPMTYFAFLCVNDESGIVENLPSLSDLSNLNFDLLITWWIVGHLSISPTQLYLFI